MSKPTIKYKPLPAPDLDRITLVDRKDVCARMKISPWTLGHWIKQGTFPKPFQLSDASYRWRLSDIEAYLDKLAKQTNLPPRIRGRAAQWANAHGDQPQRTRERVRLEHNPRRERERDCSPRLR